MKKNLPIKSINKILAVFVSISFGFGCVGETPIESNSSKATDLVTAVVVELTNIGTGELTTFQWTNSKNNTAAQADTLKFHSGVTYNGEMVVLDTTGSMLNDQIRQNPEKYQFFYGFTAEVDSLTFAVTDKESHYPGGNNSGVDLPVGIKFRTALYSSMRGTGELNVVLSRFNQLAKTGSYAGDEILLQVAFPVVSIKN